MAVLIELSGTPIMKNTNIFHAHMNISAFILQSIFKYFFWKAFDLSYLIFFLPHTLLFHYFLSSILHHAFFPNPFLLCMVFVKVNLDAKLKI